MASGVDYFRPNGTGRYVSRGSVLRGVSPDMLSAPGVAPLPAGGFPSPVYRASDGGMPVVSVVGAGAGVASRPVRRAPLMPQGVSGRLSANKRSVGARGGVVAGPMVRGSDVYSGSGLDVGSLLGVPGGGESAVSAGSAGVGVLNPLLGSPQVDPSLGSPVRRGVNLVQDVFGRGDQTSVMRTNPLNDPKFETAGQRRAMEAAAQRKMAVESRRDAAIADMQSLQTRLADGSAEREGRAAGGVDLAAMSGLSRGGYNPLLGVGGGAGVMRNGVYTPSNGVTDIGTTPLTSEMRRHQSFLDSGQVARNAEFDQVVGARNAELDATGGERQYAALRRYGMDPGGRSEQPNSPEALIAGRTDLTDEQKMAFLGARADKRAEREARMSDVQRMRTSRAQFRRGEVMGADGQIDAGASAMARAVQANPLIAAQLATQQRQADGQLAMQQAQMQAENPLLAPSTPEARREQQVARGIDLDNMLAGDTPQEFFTTVEGLALGAMDLEPESAVQVLKDSGVRPDHLQAIITQNGSSVWDFMTSQSDIDERNRKIEAAQRALELLRGSGNPQSKGNTLLNASSSASATAGSPQVDIGAGRRSDAVRSLGAAMNIGGAMYGAIDEKERRRRALAAQRMTPVPAGAIDYNQPLLPGNL